MAFLSFFIVRRDMKEGLQASSILAGLTIMTYYIFYFAFPEISPTYPIVLALVFSTLWYVTKIYKLKIKEATLILSLLYASMAFTYSVDYVFDNVLGGYQQRRIKVLLGIESDPFGAGYNVNQSMIAIGSGGVAGKGYLQGTQTKFKFVPEQSTDFIFCTVGEEWGFLGSSIVLILFLVLLMRLVMLAERQKSTFSRVYGYAVACIFFFHILINVGMTIGLAPVIGIPLPFFSYGGSSLWAFTFLLFIFLRLDTNRTELIN
jgi:rod shape determining protein RodA